MKELVCVVIPIYKNNLSHFEQISLQQCVKVLGKYPIHIIKPSTLAIEEIQRNFPTIIIDNFDDVYFKSVQSYNKLMLSASFYEYFSQYQYMLIYQLDAFVFKDELADWCKKGYDYIGAPWRIERDFSSVFDKITFTIKKKIALWFDLKEERYGKFGPMEIILKKTVGNGGFSLRKISKMIAAIKSNQKKIDQYLTLAHSHPAYNEDMFFCVEMNRYFQKVRVPSWDIALKFAVEHMPEKAYQINGGLPFGCHAWDIYETGFWKAQIEKFGYAF